MWLWSLQQWLASILQKRSHSRHSSSTDSDVLVHSILSVGRWWKKLNWVPERESVEDFTATTQRESEMSLIEKCEVLVEVVRPHPTRSGPFTVAR
jgi:hypothetical protein